MAILKRFAACTHCGCRRTFERRCDDCGRRWFFHRARIGYANRLRENRRARFDSQLSVGKAGAEVELLRSRSILLEDCDSAVRTRRALMAPVHMPASRTAGRAIGSVSIQLNLLIEAEESGGPMVISLAPDRDDDISKIRLEGS